MATGTTDIPKMEADLVLLKKELTKYGDYFNEDGHIDTEEQKQLDQMQAIILKAEKKIAELKSQETAKSNKKKRTFTVAGSGQRKILTPLKPNGSTIYFFFGFTGTKSDKAMRDAETESLADDVITAAEKGFKVIYDMAGTKKDFENALYDSNTAGIYWSGHGYMDGDIESSDGKVISPSNYDPKKVSKKIKFLILAACGSAKGEKAWEKLIGGSADFEGWKDVTYGSETNDFTDDDGVLDSASSHKGTDPSKELDDYIEEASTETKEENKKIELKKKTESSKEDVSLKKKTVKINHQHSVQLIAQPTNMSCWAAGTAMMVSWKNSMSIDPTTIADALGYSAQMGSGLHPEDTKVFKKWGLSWEAPMCYTVEGFADIVAGGPVWIAAKVGAPHVRVVTGITGDGTADGTIVHINDPWPVGKGKIYTRTYKQLAAEMEGLGADELSFAKPIYVATI